MGQAKRTNTIIIADTNILFRRGLRAVFSGHEELSVIDEAGTIDEALSKVRSLTPDILIMDLDMIKTNSNDSRVAIRQTQVTTALVCLTRHDDDAALESAIEAGAQGYMRKDSAPARIVAAVRTLGQSNGALNPNSLSTVVPDLQALAKSSERYSQATPLTSREREVARLLAEGRTVRQTASELALSMKTVEAHKLNLMRKLDIHNRASLVEYALHNGLVTA